MIDQVDALLQGSFDFRIHTAPEPDGERRGDYLEAGRAAYESQMAGFVLMKHDYPTAILAYTLNRIYPGLRAVGSIALNSAVGGSNPDAVESSAKLGAKVVWTQTRGRASNEPLTPGRALASVLEVAKAYDLVVAASHGGLDATMATARLAQSVGVERLVLTNPAARFGVEAAAELLSFGAYVELPFLAYYPFDSAGQRLRADVDAVGTGRCIVSTDFGQWTNPPPDEGMRIAIAAMLDAGMSADEIDSVVRQNPLDVLNISSG